MTSALKKKLLLSLNRPIRPQDVFATSLYPGGTFPRDLITGLDMAGKGGLFWGKARDQAGDYVHALIDTVRGGDKRLASNLTDAENTGGTLQFLQNGVRFTGNNNPNSPSTSFVGWSFRRAKKFFDAVTYTGNGVAGRQIPHGLGDVPGLIVVKRRSAADDWLVRHRSALGELFLNLTNPQASGFSFITAMSAATFTVSDAANTNGTTYVAYLFAHNPDLIQCVGFETDGAGNASISHGWSNGTQFALLKPTSIAGDWEIFDRARSPNWTTDLRLRPNLSNAEDTANRISESGGVMTFTGLTSSPRYVSMLIRSPT